MKIDFKKYSSIKIGGIHDIVMIDKIGDYKDFQIIGDANNILISNDPKPMAKLTNRFKYIELANDELVVGGATSSGKLFSYTKKNNIAGFEFISALPGCIAGLVKMNAGLKSYEIFQIVKHINIDGNIVKKDDIIHNYRWTNISGVIYEVVFDLKYGFDKTAVDIFKKMRANQPSTPSAGSCFKNPTGFSAGYLIENVGLKGFRIGDMAYSEIHANFLTNLGDGTYDDAMKLITMAKEKVKDKFGIVLELEIIII
ncbi:MAG: UDP-N-acetylenolpyruvoylglucosamine reductase [Campylobacteraceae bacterium 4484_166]|nr:MAG: UDP-N-acetylenolpyruvoylglucosamine reductase [Campylobacteraceae bacterium 4484_166]